MNNDTQKPGIVPTISLPSVPAQRRTFDTDLPADLAHQFLKSLTDSEKSGTGSVAAAPIPVSNTGIKSPVVAAVGPGMAVNESGYPVHIDWLTFTVDGAEFSGDIHNARKWLAWWSGELFTIGGKMGKRYNGYSECWDIVFSDGSDCCGVMLGWVGVSQEGDHQRGRWCFSLTGTASSMIEDWSKLVFYAQQVKNARITRCDIALDDINGDHPLSEIVALHEAGAFLNGGRPPNLQRITNTNGSGDTVNIGSRSAGKVSRHYEKGRQLMGRKYIDDAPLTWVRHELELHGKNGRVVPWEVLMKPAEYLKGAFPKAFSWMGGGFLSISIIKEKSKIGLLRLFEHGRQQIGRLVNYCRDHLELDASIVLDRLAGKPGRYPAALLEAMQVDYLPWPDIEDASLNLCGW